MSWLGYNVVAPDTVRFVSGLGVSELFVWRDRTMLECALKAGHSIFNRNSTMLSNDTLLTGYLNRTGRVVGIIESRDSVECKSF